MDNPGIRKPTGEENMSRTATLPRPLQARKATQPDRELPLVPLPQDNESEEESDVDIEVDGAIEKDETEAELERLVFGDSAGFREGLRDFTLDNEEDEAKGGARDTGLEGLDDADLFFTDLAPGQDAQPPEDEESEDETIHSKLPPAWDDSDDERMMISLASVPRLRKLRRTEAEDVINGKQYARRLRQQFQLLSPAPEWAQRAIQRLANKRRRLSDDAGSASDEDDMDIDDSEMPSLAPLSKLLQDAESLVRSSAPGSGNKRKLRPEVIDIQRQKDIPGIQPSSITSLSFHPTLPLLLSSGPSSTLYLHHLASSPPAPNPNPLLTSLHVRGCELTTTAFHPTTSRIFLSARARYFHVWDLASGRVEKVTRVYGQKPEQKTMERFKLSPNGAYMALLGTSIKGGGVLNILDAATLQWTSAVRVDSRNGIADFAWWRDGRGLCIVAKSGEVTEWDVAAQTFVARWQDEGAVGSTVLALGGSHEISKSPIGTDRWVAIGSSSGIVNVYDRRAWLAPAAKTSTSTSLLNLPANPKPTRMLDHLTTPTSNLAFSPDGQVLAMSSKWKRDALRLVHLPSCTVFKNWPTLNTPLGRITGLAWAAGSVVEGSDAVCVLAVGSEQGKVRVWEVR